VNWNHHIWSNYSDLTRPHPKWWLRKGNPLISGKPRCRWNIIIIWPDHILAVESKSQSSPLNLMKPLVSFPAFWDAAAGCIFPRIKTVVASGATPRSLGDVWGFEIWNSSKFGSLRSPIFLLLGYNHRFLPGRNLRLWLFSFIIFGSHNSHSLSPFKFPRNPRLHVFLIIFGPNPAMQWGYLEPLKRL